jgi:cell division protein FtsQ
VHAPVLSLPNLGWRWISAGVTLLLVMMLYTMSTSNAFKVNAIELTGNQRLDAAEISAGTGLIGQPIYKAIPSKVEEKLRAAFPELAKVSVSVAFPNSLRVNVLERTPILAWYRGDNATWIDPDGFAFSPRGEVPGLVQIAASGDPPRPAADPKTPVYEQPFIDPALVQAIVTVYPQVPEGAPMVYDPKYGLGWQDSHGWLVYFGRSTDDIEIKKKVYQFIVDTFTQQGIQPAMVSVAYLDAPFYK